MQPIQKRKAFVYQHQYIARFSNRFFRRSPVEIPLHLLVSASRGCAFKFLNSQSALNRDAFLINILIRKPSHFYAIEIDFFTFIHQGGTRGGAPAKRSTGCEQ